MTSRQEQLLGAIIKEYVRTAEPISSGLLCEKSDLEISPATVRAEMMGLEKAGYLQQPHTSAGRIPTAKAYRYFVDNLLELKSQGLSVKEKEHIKSEIKSADDNPHLISQQVAKVIADISDNFALSGIIDTGEFYKVGFSSLFEMPEFQEYERILRIAPIFDRFEMYLDSIIEEMFGEDFGVLIGRENPIRGIYDETVIAAQYPLPQGHNGAAFMIGPTRMRYDKNIALMKYISQIMRKHKPVED